jgi:SMI1/KNR4 family protein SUKH-1
VDPVEAIKGVQGGGLTLAPPLSVDRIARLQEELGAPLPRELRAVLGYTAGIEGTAVDGIDFTGRDMDYEDRDLFPLGLPIATDGAGNFWVLDLPPVEGGGAAVFFACHDPPILLYQSPDLGHFLDQVLRVPVTPDRSVVDDVRRDRLFNVWRTNPGTISHADALSRDDALRAFAEELGDRYTFVDLRAAEIGMGFSWGRYGRQTDVRRHGHERLFACAPPERTPGLLRRVFGRTATP